jgi:hypothetical protein
MLCGNGLRAQAGVALKFGAGYQLRLNANCAEPLCFSILMLFAGAQHSPNVQSNVEGQPVERERYVARIAQFHPEYPGSFKANPGVNPVFAREIISN